MEYKRARSLFVSLANSNTKLYVVYINSLEPIYFLIVAGKTLPGRRFNEAGLIRESHESSDPFTHVTCTVTLPF